MVHKFKTICADENFIQTRKFSQADAIEQYKARLNNDQGIFGKTANKKSATLMPRTRNTASKTLVNNSSEVSFKSQFRS
jgi:hypothetical protein